MLPQTYIESDIQYEIPYTRKIDFETKLEQEEQTEENLIKELKENAERYIEENKYPKVSYTTVSNINDNMEIGDTIQVLHPLVSIKTEVLEYEYDVISKKIKSLTFGNSSRDVKTKFDNIKNSINQISQAMSKQETLIKNQTSLINMLNKTGFVYIDENEILILDEIPRENAKNVWRFGLGGIGFSSNGYEGPFETAITMDGEINAKFITTGVMSVDRIEGLSEQISIVVSNTLEETNSQIEELQKKNNELKIQLDGLTNTMTTIGGQNLVRNSVGYFESEYWQIDDENEGTVINNTSSDVKQNSTSGSALELQAETIYQNINEIQNGEYYLSFNYKVTKELNTRQFFS